MLNRVALYAGSRAALPARDAPRRSVPRRRIQELRLPQISRGFSTEILLHKIAAGGPAGGVIATALAIVCLYSRCHDEVPYTKRERIMLVKKNHSLLRKTGDSKWASIQEQHGPNFLPETHPQARRVKEIGIRIAEANGLADDFMRRIIVVKNDNENATGVALPDGKVVLFTGMFKTTPNDDALAGVIAREIAHVVANHEGEKLSEGIIMRGVNIGLAFLEMTRAKEEAGEHIIPLYYFTCQTLNLTKAWWSDCFIFVFIANDNVEMEHEADRIGMELMAKACYDPSEMTETLRRTKHLSEEMGVLQHYRWPPKQPTLEERIERQEEWMSTLQ